MKVNERIYEMLDKKPFETQELEGHKVEMFYLDEYEDIKNEFTSKGKFAVWSSQNGTDYRLAVLKDYHTTLSDLYTKKVNSIWIDFWDYCEKASKNFSRYIVIPGTALFLLVMLLITLLVNNKNLGAKIILALAVVYVIVVLILRKVTTKKMNDKNVESLEDIKKHLGKDRFEELLKKQRAFIDDYYDALDKKFEEEEAQASSCENNEQPEEEVKVEDIKEDENK